ncbi:polyprenyl synthetase family protein [Thalassoglobus polymorphus]|uniref:All-trans-nonaprenyl-diphosphate synthase (Geranyl-diphosphate specific) n=1 Tax=Thalassoglobus polymorphus TaxID=2527994 RepID=A0A517QQ80_9PLAN|nr:polyprenyl synthetase family protein [Thalassoglobus polymorphus]QDT33790.1 All-trans-nonaprenyl-diphosphate synthase (geranyl-diphosphate specific) [Thalassoglobus polymorphus]
MDIATNSSSAPSSDVAVSESAPTGEAITTKTAKQHDDAPTPRKRNKRKSSAHLKAVPETLALRDLIKADAEAFAKTLDKANAFTRSDLEQWGREFLKKIDQPEKYLGFAMVMIGNYFWKRQFLATPFERRMLLLPHCLKHAEGCPADYDEFGLDCEKCGACSIADYKVRADQLGYKVLVAEGSPIVLKIIVEGYVDGILGVACLNVLEKAIDKVLIAGVPSFAVPLHSSDCKNTSLDESWVWEVLDKYEPLEEQETRSYVPLMRSSVDIFTKQFDELLPRVRSNTPEKAKSPLGMTEDIAYDWLSNGGKRFRPFITLAAYDAATGGEIVNGRHDRDNPVQFSPAISKVAMAIEAFHKASLIHDDIQDNDLYRYGRETLHRTQGIGPAINIGDYLIGLGYRLVNESREELGSDVACDILDSMAAAHIKLCDGQGAEMAWQDSPDWDITPLDALQIYALKTSPAFEAALFSGLRMAGEVDPYREIIPQFSRQLGVGFQILNDLKDWQGDDHNKLVAGQDALALRPTILLALALQLATPEQRIEIREIYESSGNDLMRIGKLRKIFVSCGAFEKAEGLIEKSRERSEALADSVESDEIRQLLYFFVDSILAEEGEPTPLEQQQAADSMLVSLPIVS